MTPEIDTQCSEYCHAHYDVTETEAYVREPKCDTACSWYSQRYVDMRANNLQNSTGRDSNSLYLGA